MGIGIYLPVDPQVNGHDEGENAPYIAEIIARAPRMTEEQAAKIRRLYRYGPPDAGKPPA